MLPFNEEVFRILELRAKEISEVMKCIIGVTRDANTKNIIMQINDEYVPDFNFRYNDALSCFLVYIFIGDEGKGKHNAGYPICSIDSYLGLSEFIGMYKFLYTCRNINKIPTF